MSNYPQEPNDAQKLFWDNIRAAVENTTKTKIMQMIEEMKKDVKQAAQEARQAQENTKTVPSFLRSLGTIFKAIGTEGERQYPGKKP